MAEVTDEVVVDDHDRPWKEAEEHRPIQFTEYFASDIHATIDQTQEYDTLSEEMRRSSPRDEEGKRIADKVFKFWTHSGDPLYLHAEVQCHWEDAFADRMNETNRRILERFGVLPVTLVIYGDDHPRWEPRVSVMRKHGCVRAFRFRTVKLLRYANRIEELLTHANPFA